MSEFLDAGSPDYPVTEWNDGSEAEPVEKALRAFLGAEAVMMDGDARQSVVESVVTAFESEATRELAVAVVNKMISDGDDALRLRIAVAIREIVERWCKAAANDLEPGAVVGDTLGMLIKHLLLLLADDGDAVQKSAREAFEHLLSEGAPVEATVMAQTALLQRLEEIEANMQRSAAGDTAAESFLLEFLVVAPTLTQAVLRTSGAEVADEMLLPRLETLCSSPNFRVRKGCVACVAQVTGAVPGAMVDKLVPFFLALTVDEIWGVRKACAEELPAISKNSTQVTREGAITECFVRLAQDESRWVRCAVFKSLGALVATFVPPPPDQNGLRQRVAAEIAAFNTAPATPIRNDRATDESLEEAAPADAAAAPPSSTAAEVVARVGGEALYRRILDCVNESSDTNGAPDVLQLAGAVGDESSDTDGAPDVLQLGGATSNESETDGAAGVDTVASDVDDMGGDAEGEDEADDSFGEMPSFKTVTPNSTISKRRVSPAPWDLDRLATFLEEENKAASAPPPDVFEGEKGATEPPAAAEGEAAKSEAEGVPEAGLTSYTTMYWKAPVDDIDDELLAILGMNGDESPADDMAREVEVSQDIRDLAVKVDAVHMDPADTSDSPGTSAGLAAEAEKIGGADAASAAIGDVYDEATPTPPNPCPLPAELVHHFNLMSDQASAKTIDTDIAKSCAFTIPALVWALGREHWPLIRETYNRMAVHLDWRIRATLAHSSHVCAMILGREIAEQDLMKAYLGFLGDWEEVKDGAISSFADFVRVISPIHRDEFLTAFIRLSWVSKANSQNNWRRRTAVSDQLREVLDLFPKATITGTVCPTLLELGTDEVACVRKSAYRSLATLVGHLAKCGDGAEEFYESAAERMLGTERSCDRQGLVHLANEMIGVVPAALFTKAVLPRLLPLTTDTVPNVRLVLSRTLARTLASGYLASDEVAREKVVGVLSILGDDPDPDVAFGATLPRLSRPVSPEAATGS